MTDIKLANQLKENQLQYDKNMAIKEMPIKLMCAVMVHEDNKYDENCPYCIVTTEHRNKLPYLFDWMRQDLDDIAVAWMKDRQHGTN